MNESFHTELKMNPLINKPFLGRRIGLWLILLFGMVLAGIVAYLVSQGLWVYAVIAAVLVPLVFLLNAYPFTGVIVWLLVMPFVSVLPGSGQAYWAIHRLLPLATLGLVLLSRILKVRALPAARIGPPELAMGVLALVVPGLILYYQPDPDIALIRFADRMIIPFCMYLVIRLTAPREKEFSQLLWVALFIAFSQSLIGFLSWAAPQVLPKLWQYLQGVRTTGSLKDPDLYALMLIFSAILFIHTAVNHKSKWFRLILFLASGLCAIFAFLSLERAAWLGGVLVTIGLLTLYPKVMFRLLIIGCVVMLVLGTGIMASHIALSIDRFSESNPVYDRIVVFDAMWQMVEVKPVLGWGYETLDENIRPFYRRVGEASLPTRFVTSHNTYLTILTELGILGFCLYLFPVVWWFILSFRVWRRLPKEGYWSRLLLGSLWLVMLFNFTVSNFIDMRWFPIGVTLWWLVLGLISNIVYPYLKGRDIRSDNLAGIEHNRD